MDKTDNKNISKVLELARELIVLAKDGECESKDDGCMLLYGIVRDCGYRIDTNARKEKRIHESRVELR